MSNHYTYRAEWSPEDGEYVGLVAEFPSLSWLAATAAEAVAGVSDLVDGILADMADSGETPPEPLTQRRYSGNLSFRTSPAQHRRLAIEAAEQGVSVNQLLVFKTAIEVVRAGATDPAGEAPPVENSGEAQHVVVEHFIQTAPKPLVPSVAWADLPDEVKSAVTEQMKKVVREVVIPSGITKGLLSTPGLQEALASATERFSTNMQEVFDEIGGFKPPVLDSLIGPQSTK